MKKIAAALALLVLPAVAHAQTPAGGGHTIAVFEPITVGVDQAQGTTVSDLVRDELTRLGYRVTPRSAMPEGTCADELCAAEKGKALGVGEAMILRLSRLEQKVLVVGALVDVASGRVEISDRATALSLDDMDAVAPRLTRALVQRVPYASTVGPDSVTANEAKEPMRQKAMFTTGLRISGFVPTGDSYAGATYMYGAEWVNYYEVRDYSIEAALGGRWTPSGEKTTGAEWFADLGAYYYLRNADVAPFVGAGVGLHGVALDRTTTDNLGNTTSESFGQTGTALWAGGGVTLLRSADVHVVGTAKYTIDLFDIDGKPANGVMVGLAVTYTKRGSICCLW